MQQTTLEMFLEFLQEQNHTKGTVNSYVRLIRDLEEPPETDNPKDLLYFIDDALSLKKADLKRYFISYWNNRRICSANGGLPPMVKRQQYYDSLKEAA